MFKHLALAAILTISISTIHIDAKYTLNCNTSSPCTNKITKIPSTVNDEVDINCIGDNICRSVTFIFPSNVTAVIKCSGYDACFNTTFNALASNALIYDATGNESVSERSHIICPSKGDCKISVSSKYGMAHSIIDASQTISGDLYITTLYDWVLNDTDIYCPILASCIINCQTGWGACANMHVQGEITGLLSITVRGGDATLNSRIICPDIPSSNGDKNCKIHGTGDYGSEFRELNIYSTNGLADVDLILDYNLVKEDNNPVMHCGFGYGDSCELVYISSSSWKCKDADSPCNN